MVREQKSDDKWIGIYWRPAAAIVYLLICLFDFIVVPAWLGLHGSTKLTDIVMLIKDLPPETQVAVINLKLSVWQPLTLMGGGLFHLAFGAILGAAAWSRGQERITAINNGMYETNDGYYSGPSGQSPMAPMMNNFGAIAGSMQASTQTTQTTQTSVQVDNPDAGGYNPEMQDAPQR